MDANTINNWFNKSLNNSHPNWNDLKVAYTFDNVPLALDLSTNNYLLMPSTQGMFDFSEYPITGVDQEARRMKISFMAGIAVN